MQPPPAAHRHILREQADDGSAGAAARRALSQPAWSVSELQQRTQYVGTIADDIQRHYSFGRVLGSGSFGEVREATHRLTDSVVAIKKIDKLKAATARLRTRIAMEIRLHQRLRHQNIVHVYEVIEGARNVYLVMENLPTTLLALLKEKKVLSEAEARPLFSQLLAALAHCHKHSIVHRDVKLENLLLDASRQHLKLCDFGFAVMTRTHKLTVACGSPSYNCPEIVAKRQYHGVPADVWSSGVLLFVILVGAFPFTGSTHESLNRRIMGAQYKAPPELSLAAQDLIRRCLQVDPDRRASLAEMEDHPWLREGPPLPRAMPRGEIPEQEVHATLETLGLSRVDSREAFDHLRRNERSHVTVAFELLSVKLQGGSGGSVHSSAQQQSQQQVGSRRLSGPAASQSHSAVTHAVPSAHSAHSVSMASRVPVAAEFQMAAAAATSPSNAEQSPAVGPLRATAVKPQMHAAAQRPPSSATVYTRPPATAV